MTTKDKILNTSLKLFASQGIEKTSTIQITQEVGIASGTLFVHFRTKQELIDTLYVQIKKKAFSRLIQQINAAQSIEAELTQKAKMLIDYFLKNYDAFRFMELVEVSPIISATAMQVGRQEYKQLCDQIMVWQSQGSLKPIDLELILAAIWALCSVLIKFGHQNKQKEIDEKQVQIIWQAIRA